MSKNALYSALNRNLLKAKVITLEKGITIFSVGDYCFEKCTVKVSSTPVYVCKDKEKLLNRRHFVTQTLIYLCGVLVDFSVL